MIQVGVDVGVVEFDGGEHRHPGPEVHELGALVEKGGVVFVALQDHVRAPAHPVIGLEIPGDAAHHEAGVQAQGVEQPGDERRGGGLAVGAGHHQALALAHQEAVQRLRQRQARDVAGQQGLGLGVVPADDVAHHRQVRRRIQVGRGVTVLHPDAQTLQKGAHGRVGVFIGAADPVALFL